MIILAIETSCDDTGIALVKGSQKEGCRILSNVVSSQIKIHAPFGGIVPNLAARAHLENILPCLKEALKKADYPRIDLITVTIGPGLIPSLLVGVNFAKALAYNWQKPITGVNHIEGHIYANWLSPVGKTKTRIALSDTSSPRRHTLDIANDGQVRRGRNPQWQPLSFPILCLVVSGGHTQLILMKNHGKYQLLGQTRDDAAGEAFDKVAKLLNLGYPGGPIISQKAKQGNPQSVDLPRPMINSNDFDFSFSGLKTAVLYLVKKLAQPPIQRLPFQKTLSEGVPFGHVLAEGEGVILNARPLESNSQKQSLNANNIFDISASFQQAVIDVLVAKTIKAAKKYKTKNIILSGGVAANQELRGQMNQAVKKELPDSNFYVPETNFCTDNAAMIAAAAFYRKEKSQDWQKIKADANLQLFA